MERVIYAITPIRIWSNWLLKIKNCCFYIRFWGKSVGFRWVRVWTDLRVPVHVPCFHSSLTRAFQSSVSVFFFCNYSLLIMLLQVVLIFLSPSGPLHSAPPTPSGNPPIIVFVHGSYIYVLCLFHFLYCTLYPHSYSVTTYLYFLIPSPLHPFFPSPSIWWPSKCSPYPWFCLFSSFAQFVFLDSVVRYVFLPFYFS